MKEIQLRVAEARQQRDVGRGIARIDSRVMDEIGVTVGDIIEIEGKRKTAARVWPAYPEDRGLDIIRIDGWIRKNCGASLNDYVKVRKAEAKEASYVKLAPVDIRISVDRDFIRFVKDRLIDRPLVKGDTVLIMMLGHSIPFLVVKTRPMGIVRVTHDTEISVLSEPVPEIEVTTRTTYEDIGGLHEAIQRIREMVELPLRHPEVFRRLGIDPPKGVLLYGPPGCGKTLLARAVANESEANFYAINGPEIMSKFYGESEARLRNIFMEAEKNAPSIIFIDEIDAIAPKRSEVTGEVERRVVAQLLALMDGLKGRGNVIVIAATNRPEALDPALRRPGRFDREIEIGIPDKQGRFEILQIHTRGMPLADDVDLKKLAEITHGYTGADLAALCREAAMKALRRYLPKIDLEEKRIPHEVLEQMVVTMEDFMNAYKEVTPTAMREVYVETPTVHWDDIGGLEEVKQQLKEAVEWPLKYPEAFKRMGIRPPRGILLYGPPGCGKTLLARAVATESEANFIAIKGPEIY
ncbi:MAG TPA: AAA family ATPase, partial [Candidatus Bathyarchaeota archaeon]|nr:AAA family ATPase [Candidatus Bathyarchaeota archaeon]